MFIFLICMEFQNLLRIRCDIAFQIVVGYKSLAKNVKPGD